MRKIIMVLTLGLFVFEGSSQKNFILGASANINFATKGLSTNDAGLGITLHSNLFSKNKLRLRTEASIDHFFGSKLLVTDAAGNAYTSNPTMLSVKLGPEFFLSDKISLAALYGFTTYNLYEDKVRAGNLKLLLCNYLGIKKRTALGVYYSTLNENGQGVHFFGASLGYRFL